MLISNRAKKILCFLFVLASGIILKSILQNAPTPELSKDLWYALPAFMVFVMFLIGIFSWGALIRVCSKLSFHSRVEEVLFDLSIGSVFFYILAYVLTPFGLFSSNTSVFLWVILAGGVSLGFSRRSFTKVWFGWTTAIPLLVVIIHLIEGLQFHQHGDPYITYLPAPRIWAETGSFQSFKEWSQFYLSTSFESLYAWGTALMGLESGRGLDISQWFSQWTSGGISVLGLVLAAFATGEKLSQKLKVARIWIPLMAITAIQIPSLRWMSNIAKNDLGVAFWGVSAFYFGVLLPDTTPILLLWIGILMGASAIGKLTVSIFAIILCIPIFQRSKTKVIFYMMGGVLGALPVMIRNWSLTHNPVYPWLPSLFPDPNLKGSILIGTMHATSMQFEWSKLGFYFYELIQECPLILVPLILLLTSERKTIARYFWIPVVSFLVFTFTLRPATEIRYQGPTLVLLVIFSTYFAFYTLERFGKNRFGSKWMSPLLAIAILALSNISFFTLFQIGGTKFTTWKNKSMHMNEVGGPSKVWIREHLKPDQKLLIVGDGYPYYLLDYAMTQYSRFQNLEELIFNGDLPGCLKLINESKYHYVYFSNDSDYVVYRPKIDQLMKFADSKWDHQCNPYHEGGASIWDLECLNQMGTRN